jgi:NAD(P)H-nitrite reductase large subunit
LGLNGENEFVLSTDIANAKALGNAITNYHSAAIVGGGFIALGIAATLKSRGYEKVTLFVRRDIMRSHLDEDWPKN